MTKSRRRWEDRYRAFARQRGFPTFNDWPYHRRGFLECWAEPGFHRFWRVWNPGIAYFVHRLFLRLGGRRRWALAVIGSFVACGVAHTLVVTPFLCQWSFTVVTAFACFGVLTVLSRGLAPWLRQERWPVPLNVLVNVGLVLASFDLGFRVDRALG
jgi:hypothetical protein